MTRVLLAGLSDHDAAAIEILISMNWRDKRCVFLKRTADFALPVQDAQGSACEQVVLDLGGVGLHKYSAEHEQALLRFLAGRSALILTWKNDGGWAQAPLALGAGQRIEFLAAPYSSADVKVAMAALDKPASASVRAAKSAALAKPTQAAEKVAVLTNKPELNAAAAPSSAAPLPLRGNILAPALWDLLPGLQRSRFLRLAEKLRGSSALALYVGAAQLLLHPKEGWVAAGMPVSALIKVLGNVEQLDTASLERLSAPVAAQMQQELTAGRSQRYMLALDVVLWELCSHAMQGLSLQLQGDAMFKLQRFPNVTQLAQVGNLDVQLAAMCVRGERSLQKMLQLFPGQEAKVLRFVALALLSGLGTLQAPVLALSPSAGLAKNSKLPATRGHKERRGFLRSLLDKLF